MLQIPFMRFRFFAFALSGGIIIASAIALLGKGVNISIDFVGGAVAEIQAKPEISISDIRETLRAYPELQAETQKFGIDNVFLIRARLAENLSPQKRQKETLKLKNALRPLAKDFRRIEFVGPSFGVVLRNQAIIAILLSLTGIFIYIWLRFEWQFAIGAIGALIHDVIAAMGFFAISGLEFNTASVAALLTIAGYSINDTIVIYDRARENLKKYKKEPLEKLIDLSLNQSLRRTFLTSATTLLALLCIIIFGEGTARNFALPMAAGVIIGTYSSIAFAAPFLTIFPLKPENDEERNAK